MEPIQYEKRGYLNEDFRLFHLADNQHEEIEYHYHTFHKIVILLAGKAGYAVEGETFQLSPGDFVLVGRGSVHRPCLESGDFYERMILYISPEYLQSLSTGEDNLEQCFLKSQQEFHYVFHASQRIRDLFAQLEKARLDEGFGTDILCRSIFLQLIVEMNRDYLVGEQVSASYKDKKMVPIIQYVNSHLLENLTIEELADRFYISKFHMMRRFKETTGYSVHQYLQEKRLLLAQELINQGMPLAQVAKESGYQDYSTFSRAYKSHYGHPPTK